jgi:alcohol dehydrogenase (cytochrome c)
LVQITPFVDRIDLGAITRDGQVTAKVYPEKEGDPVHFYPGPAGAKEWTHAAYSPKTGLFYVRSRTSERPPPGGAGSSRRASPTGARAFRWTRGHGGSISAFDGSGEEKWRWRNELPMCASTLATGGDLVFAGEPSGEFNALDARTGEQLWQFQCGSGHHSSPSTYTSTAAVRRRTGRLGRLGRGFLPACSGPGTEAR